MEILELNQKKQSFEVIEGGGVTSASGFEAAGVTCGLKRSGKADLALLYSRTGCNSAGTFTSNLFPAAPVVLCKERVAGPAGIRAVVVAWPLDNPPNYMVADISTNGIVMTGGGSLVSGFDKLVTARTGIPTVVANDAIQCVAKGTGKSLDSVGDMQDGTMNLSRRKQLN